MMKGRRERMMTTGRVVAGRSAPNKVIPGGQPPRVLDRDIILGVRGTAGSTQGPFVLDRSGKKLSSWGETYIAGAS